MIIENINAFKEDEIILSLFNMDDDQIFAKNVYEMTNLIMRLEDICSKYSLKLKLNVKY